MNFLDAIVRSVDERVKDIKPHEARWLEDLASMPTVRSLKTSLKTSPRLAMIAECKQKSPSKGWLTDAYDPVSSALAYEKDGARAVSVLTEPEFFAGDLTHLRQVKSHIQIPVLRKDFVRDPVQLLEARVHGADAALLIVRIVDDVRLKELYDTAVSIGIEVLIEVHTLAEAERAMRLNPPLMGVNNRDLDSFDTHLSFSKEMSHMLSDATLGVSESGIRTVEDLGAIESWGYEAVLVGETLMRGHNLLRDWAHVDHH